MGKQKDKKSKAKGGPAAVAQSPEEIAAAEAEMLAQVKEVEERLQVLTKELRQVESSIRNCAMEAKRAQLTTKELEPLTDDAKIYRQVGRMWIQQPKKDMANHLQATTALNAVQSQQLKQAHNKLELKMKGEADGLRELLGTDKMKKLQEGTLFGGGGPTGPPEPGKDEDSIVPLFGKSTAPATAAVADAVAADKKGDGAK